MRERLLPALVLLAAAIPSLPALAQVTTEPPDYWQHGWDWGWGHMIFGSLMMILVWGGIIVVVVLAVRWLGAGSSHSAAPPASPKTPLDILKERFARGEIDKEEFEERRRTLGE